MSHQLYDAFERLADRAPGVDASVSSALRTWETAKRQRRRAVASTSFVTVLVLVCLGAIGWAASALQQSLPAPASGGVSPAIPNELYVPSPWVQSTSDAGPIGPLALVGEAPHRTSWTHVDDFSLFGVSATTGAYRFIDLPGVIDQGGASQEYALSPDGREIGYWLGGHPGGQPGVTRAVGFAAYNTVTGRVTSHLVPTTHGLSGSWLVWSADSSRLVVDYGQYQDGGGQYSRYYHVLSWSPKTGNILRLVGLAGDVGAGPSAGPAGLSSFHSGGPVLTIVDPDVGRRTTLRVSIKGAFGAAISPDATMLAYNEDTSTSVEYNSSGAAQSSYVDLAHIPPVSDLGAPWRSQRLDVHSPKVGIVGWIDNSHLLLTTWTGSRLGTLHRVHFVSYDIRTGTSTDVIATDSAELTFQRSPPTSSICRSRTVRRRRARSTRALSGRSSRFQDCC